MNRPFAQWLRSLKARLGGKRTLKRSAATGKRRIRLGTESLEDRWMPSNAGILDPTFGTNGVVSTDVPGSRTDSARDLVVNLTDGKILVAGYSSGGTTDLVLARYNADGSPDTGFGTDGTGRVIETSAGVPNALAADTAGNAYVLSNNRLAYYSAAGVEQWATSTGLGYASDVAVDGSGRAVVAGYRYDYNPATGYNTADFGVARYNPDGTPDPTAFAPADFGAGSPSNDYAQSVAIDSQGRIVVAGYYSTNAVHAGVARYDADGTLDTSFDGDGLATIDFVQSNYYQYNYLFAVAVDAADDVVVGGYGQAESYQPDTGYYNYTTGSGLARFRAADGALDGTFGTGGKVFEASTSGITALAVDGSGRVVAGESTQLVRYTSTGGRDQGFGSGGAVYLYNSAYGYLAAAAVAVQSDGKIVAAGTGLSYGTKGNDFALTRLNGSDGSPDTGFGTSGVISTDITGSRADYAQDLVVNLPGGKILVAGYSQAVTTDLVLARYNADGSPDTSYGTAGTGRVVETNAGSPQSLAADAAGNAYVLSNNQLAYYSADGTRQWRVSVSGLYYGTDVAVDGSGRAVVAGYRYTYNPATGYSNDHLAVVRYNTDGSADPTAFAPADSGAADSSYAQSVVIDSHGRIVVAGNASGHAVVARYNADGALDTSFDEDGLAAVEFARGYDSTWSNAYTVAVDADDDVIVGGNGGGQTYHPDTGYYTSVYGGGLERFRGDTGAADASFDNDGSLINPYTNPITSLAVDGSGRVVTGDGSSQLRRYTSGGQPDLSFGGTGMVGTPIYNIRGVAVQTDGNVVAAGAYYSSTTGPDLGLVRYTGTDDTPPAVSAPDLSTGSDTGASAGDNITSAGALVFNGTAEAGSLLKLWEGSTLLGTVSVPGYSNYGSYPWSVSVTGLGEGNHTLYATATDFAGNTSTSGTLTVQIDRTAPAIAAQRDTPANGFGWNNTDVAASYTATDGGAGLPTGAGSGSFTFTAEGADQSHTFTVTDLAGNTASATVSGVNIDKTAPTLSGAPDRAANTNGWYNADVTVSFAAADVLSGLVAEAASQTLGEGPSQAVTRTVTDKAGNSTSVTVGGIFVDETKPTAAITDAPPAVTNSTAAHFAFSGDDGLALSGVDRLEYQLDGGIWTVATGTTADFTGLAEGGHTFAVRSFDKAGNVSDVATSAWTVDRATGVSVTAASGVYGGTTTLEATLTWHGDGSALAGKTVAFTINGVGVGSATADGTGLAVLSGVSLAGINAGTYATAVGASFAGVTGDTGYTASSGAGSLSVAKANATISVTGYTGVYDGQGHGATGTAKGVNGEALTGLDLGASFTDVPGGTANWTFTDATGNYNDAHGTVDIVITKATPTVSVTGGSFVNDGTAHGATGSVTGVLGESLTTPPLTFAYSYTDDSGNVVALPGAPVEPGYYTVTATFAGDGNYTDKSGTATIMIAFEVNTLTDLSKAFKAGRTIPIKIQLIDDGINVSSAGIDLTAVRLDRVNADGTVTQVSLMDAGGSNPDNLFRYDASLGGYIFNLSTKGLTVGTYNFYWMAEGDPTEHELSFQLT